MASVMYYCSLGNNVLKSPNFIVLKDHSRDRLRSRMSKHFKISFQFHHATSRIFLNSIIINSGKRIWNYVMQLQTHPFQFLLQLISSCISSSNLRPCCFYLRRKTKEDHPSAIYDLELELVHLFGDLNGFIWKE